MKYYIIKQNVRISKEVYKCRNRIHSYEYRLRKRNEKEKLIGDINSFYELTEIEDPSIFTDYERKETLSLVINIINDHLSDHERKLIFLTYYTEMKKKDIARTLGLTPQNYSKRLRIVLNKIRKMFEDIS